jgi:rubredoxin
MNKIQEIFTAWAISFDPNQEQSELASERIAICNECEFKATTPIIHCSLCGCALRAKIFTPLKGNEVTPTCPQHKWKEVEDKFLP